MNLEEKLSKPLIISCALTGAAATRKDNPAIPYSPEELVESALEAVDAGASIIHVHVREPDGTPSNRAELYAETFAGIRQGSDALICVTTGSSGQRFKGRDRLTALALGPDIASVDAGSMNFGDSISENSMPFLRTLTAEIKARDVLPEVECFDVGMIGNALRLRDEGLLPGRTGKWWFQFCLGVQGGAPWDASVMLTMRNLLPANSEWSVMAVGIGQLPMAMIAMVEGGHIRTGLEDNVMFRRGQLADGNAQSVRRIVGLARDVSRPVATPADARRLLELADYRPLLGKRLQQRTSSG